MFRRLSPIALASVLALPALAQVQPLPPNPLSRPPVVQQPSAPIQPRQPGTPTIAPAPAPAPSPSALDASRITTPLQPIARFSPPVLELQNSTTERTPGQINSFTVRVSNLGTARFVHLYALDLGCRTDVQPAVVGFKLFRQKVPRREGELLTSDQGNALALSLGGGISEINFRAVLDQTGVPVDSAGVATFPLTGVTGLDTSFSGDVLEHPDHAALQRDGTRDAPGSGYNLYLRRLITIGPNNSTCTPTAFVALRDATGGWYVHDEKGNRLPIPAFYQKTSLDTPMPLLVTGKPWFIKAHRRVTVENTSQLEKLFDPKSERLGIGSVCSGTSTTPHGSFPVGVVRRNNDIAMVIRSGPLGTKCSFQLAAGRLPDGVRLETVQFSESKVGSKCTMDRNAATLAFPGGFGLDRVTQQIKPAVKITGAGRFGFSVHGWLNPFVFPDPGLRYAWQGLTNPMVATLDCEMTLLNDHEIALVMERATFDVPIGVSFP